MTIQAYFVEREGLPYCKITGLPHGMTFGQIDLSHGSILVPSVSDARRIIELLREEDEDIEAPPPGVFNFLETKALQTRARKLSDEDLCRYLGEEIATGLYEHQVDIIRKIYEEFDGKGLIAADMGLGKTAIALCIAMLYGRTDILCIVPKNLLRQWETAVLQWTGLTATIIKTGKQVHSPISIITYDCAKINSNILNHKWTTVIIDECHNLRNGTTQKGRILLKLSQQARCSLLLSGTPIPKCLSEIYNQLLFINKSIPHIFGTYTEFIRRYCNADFIQVSRDQFIWKPQEMRYLEEFHFISEHHMIRLTQDQVNAQRLAQGIQQEIVNVKRYRHYHEIELEDSEITRKLQEIAAQFNSEEKEKEIGMYMKNNQHFMEQYRLLGHAKFVQICKFYEQTWLPRNPRKKAAIYVNSIELLKKYQDYFENTLKLRCISIYAETEEKERGRIIRSLANKNDHAYQVGILSIGTCSTGAHLAPGVADIFFAEHTFLPSSYDQIEARAYRIGAEQDVNIYYITAKGTLDDVLMRMVKRRMNSTSLILDKKKRVLQFDSVNGAKRPKLVTSQI